MHKKTRKLDLVVNLNRQVVQVVVIAHLSVKRGELFV